MGDARATPKRFSGASDALAKIPLPSWVSEVRITPKIDHQGEAAIDVTVIARSGERDALRDGALLNDLALQIHDALVGAGIDLWPFVDFVSADDIEAA